MSGVPTAMPLKPGMETSASCASPTCCATPNTPSTPETPASLRAFTSCCSAPLPLVAAVEIGQHRGAAAVGDQMVDGGGREQHPLPPVFPLDPRRGLVRGHNLAPANFCGG